MADVLSTFNKYGNLSLTRPTNINNSFSQDASLVAVVIACHSASVDD